MATANYFIPPELRKHVQLIKELPEIVADTVTDPDTYAALNELLNPVKWIESAGQKSGKFFESGGKDIESGAEALIETLGLAAGPMAQKYASTLAPMVSRGVGSGVKSLQELVMPLGATDDVAKKVPQKEGISRRDFIAGGTALGTLAGLKQAGDLLPPTKGIKAAAKTPLASTIKALNSVKSNYKKVSNEQKLIDESILRLKTKNKYAVNTSKEKIEIKKLEKLYDTTEMKVIKSVDSMEEKISSLVSSLLKQSKKDLMRLNDDQLKSLRGHLTDNYYYSGFSTTKYVKFAPSDEFNTLYKTPVDPKNFFKSDLADKTRMRKLSSSKESSEKTDYEKIVLRVDEVLEERGLTTIEDVNKLKTLALRIPGEVGEYNQGGLTTDEHTQQAFNQGGYGIAGKFTSDTGVSAAKEKGNFEGFGYKGEAKEAPAETKPYGQVTGDPSKDKSESTVSVDKTVKPLTPAPFQKEQFDQYKKVSPEIYPDLKFKQTDKDGPLGYMGQPTGQTLKQRQEEVKRTKKLASLSETKSMAAGRVKNSVFNRLKRISKSFFGPSGRGGKNEIFEDPKNITDVQESMEYWKIKAPMIRSVIESGFLINAPSDLQTFNFNEETGEYDLGKNKFVGNLDQENPLQVETIHKFYTQATGAKTVEELDIYNPKSSWFWCSAFIHDILTKVGAKPLETYDSYDRARARKYINYGEKIADVDKNKKIDLSRLKTGDILIIGDPETLINSPKGSETIGAITHLTIYVGPEIEKAFGYDYGGDDLRPVDYFLGLGGNQRSKRSLAEVNIKPFHISEIVGVRRINEVTPEMKKQLAKDNPNYAEFIKTSSATPQDYVVKSGDNLDKIAKQFNTTVERLQELNGIENPNEIYVDQNIKLFNQGGLTMEQQMSLFQEGGMKDDGMDVDPVSGNDVPPGSLAKEVRDDIPAQLSEGEYVVPADVVQYYGVKFFEDLRMEAKRGLAEMDATGRIGGEPMSMTMIAIGGAEEEQKERQKKALGGIVGFDNGGGVSKDMAEVQKYGSFNPYNFSVVGGTPFSPIARTGQSMGITTGDTHSKMFYHPDGRVQAVPGKMVTVNGKQKFLPNTQYAEFTESPWSDTPPSQAKAQETQAPKEDREDKNRSPFDAEAQRLQNENSLKISADRLKIPLETYAKLSIGKRFKLMGEEFKAMRGNEVDRDKINAILEDEDTGFDLSSVTKLLGGLVASFTGNPLIAVGARILGGILSGDDTDDAPTTSPSTVRSSGSSGPVATSTVFDSLAQASKAGFHGQNVNIKGKGVQKVEFADPKFDAAMKKESSDREDKSEARKKLAENIKSSRAGTQTGSTSQTTTSVKEDDFSKYPGVPDELNKGGLINKPKRNPKKPRGKGLGNRK